MTIDGPCVMNGSKCKCIKILIWRPGMKQLMEDRKLIKDNKKVIINDVVCTVTEAGLVTR